MKKKALSLILSAAMALSLTIVPVSAVSVSNFSDVSSDSWYYDSVSYVAEKDYMNGTSATTFEPNGNMTRAMFATVISRVAGAEVDNSAVSEFTDVESGKWYTGAIEWGVENDLLNGYGNGLFGTNNSITRQDICTLTQRFLNWYCEQNNCTLAVDPKVESFTDAASIADYAKEAVEFCRDAGLLTGYEDGSFRPLGTATRAEIAAVIERIEMAIESAEPAGPVVSYTDEDGNKATLAIKAGDVITVNPDGGSVTYDGTTHRDEFTITATEDGITLPNATRSGYRFDGWKVEKDANGAYIFTAQWTRTSSGGGGNTGGDDDEQTLTEKDYQVNLAIEAKGYSGDISAIDEDNQYGLPTNYHVIFDEDGVFLPQQSDDVNLITIMKDMADPENIKAAINALKTIEIDGTPVLETIEGEEGKTIQINEFTVHKVGISQILEDSATKQQIADLVNKNVEGLGVTENDVTYLLSDLDEGTTTILNGKQKAIVEAINEKIQELKYPENEDDKSLYEIVQEKVDPNLLSTLGLKTEGDVYALIDNYLEKLNKMPVNNTAGAALMDNSEISEEESDNNSVAGGVEITVNPVQVLIDQYNDNAETKLQNLLKNNISNSTDQEAIFSYLVEGSYRGYGTLSNDNYGYGELSLFDLCNPENFFTKVLKDSDNQPIVYQLNDSETCSNLIRTIIDTAESVREKLIDDNPDNGDIDQGEMKSFINQLINKAKEYVGDDNETLNKITGEKIEALAGIATSPNPTLVDLFKIMGSSENGIDESINIQINGTNIQTLLDKVFNAIGVNESDVDTGLMDELKTKLMGDYSISFTVTPLEESKNCQKN